MLTLPPIPNAARYAGLYIFDFGEHVAVGYTAAEIAFLRAHPEFAGGTAYEIYRADADGRIELRGARDDRLHAREAFCFLRADASAANDDYLSLKRNAEANPPPCSIELQLSKLYSGEFPYVTALLHAAAHADAVAGWLSAGGFMGGDQIQVGVHALAWLQQSGGVRLASCQPAALQVLADRTPEEILLAIHEPIQRCL